MDGAVGALRDLEHELNQDEEGEEATLAADDNCVKNTEDYVNVVADANDFAKEVVGERPK